jgi:hypothetical protein
MERDHAELDTLSALNPTLAGNAPRQCNPHPTRSLAWAAGYRRASFAS